MRPTAYRRNARGVRDRQALEGVRLQAGALFAAGRSQAQVARELGVARQVVEVVADELGPSLRWATATTTRARPAELPGGVRPS